MLFTSTVGTYGYDIEGGVLTDTTLQRPFLFYGATKVFAEHMGLFYKRKFGLDFRCVRYPSIIGPGVTTPGVAQYTSLVFEKAALGQEFIVWVPERTRIPIMNVEDAADSIVQLAAANVEQIETVNYLVAGISPTPSAAELVSAARERFPEAVRG